MYTALKNPAQAKIQLDKLEEMANLAKNDSLTEVLLYTKPIITILSTKVHKAMPVSANLSTNIRKEGLRQSERLLQESYQYCTKRQ